MAPPGLSFGLEGHALTTLLMVFIRGCLVFDNHLQQQREDDEHVSQASSALSTAAETALGAERQLENLSLNEEQGNIRIRLASWWDWERARAAVQLDYMGPTPIFNDKQFERVFRITRNMAQFLYFEVGNRNPFFTQRRDASGKLGICPQSKFLMGIKQIAYGCSCSAFQDYFQMKKDHR